MNGLEHLVLTPLKVDDIPAELQWCIYPEEREMGEILLPRTVYDLVLALRWILTYTQSGYEWDFETWKVYWKVEDKYGFRTKIYLFRDKVEQYDSWDDESVVEQPQTCVELASLCCCNGKGIISAVYMSGVQPYGGNPEMGGVMGVRRLLEDAILASQATHHTYPFTTIGDYTCTRRIAMQDEADGDTLGFNLESDGSRLTGLGLKVWPRPYWW